MQQKKFAITIIILVIFLSANRAKVMRNNALITKMVSNFHQNNDACEPNKDFESVLIRMQVVLCKNFPTIPCDLITQDQTLKKLIEKSIQQINHKKFSLYNKTTPFPGYPALFPSLNNEDLTNFIQMSDLVNRHEGNKHNQRKKLTREGNRKVNARTKEKKTYERRKKIIKNKSKATSFYNRKKLRKFYPHKVKYADKNSRNVKEDFGDNDAEQFSVSVEVPDMPLTRQHQHFTYKVEPDNPPVWRIDYTKHGKPSINNLFDFDLVDRFNRKIMKSGPIVADGNEQTRKDVLHSELFTKNNFVKTNDVNSDDVN
ncbi:uncharacterized protein [Maniola hyperantus]|uniref:uncharacterized protein n=1 Tax=Aphantopus hyperantus TaxID=2795564 RepID=UPI0015690484|nr:uncharacterized protein LOC117984001 [Maniola hyperantus]